MATRNPIPCYYPDPHLPIRVIQHRGTFEHDAYPVHVHQDVTWEFCYVVRGQVTVCLTLGAYYATALMLAGLQFGLVVGAIAGAITFTLPASTSA